MIDDVESDVRRASREVRHKRKQRTILAFVDRFTFGMATRLWRLRMLRIRVWLEESHD